MEVILKTLHYFSILFAGAVTFRGVVTQAAYMEAGDTPTLHIGKVFAEMGHIGLGSIVTLWVIVVGLSHLIYYSLAINGAIYVKLLGAAIVLFISAYANLHVYQAIKAKRAPNGALMKRLVQGERVSLVLAFGVAAVAFSALAV